MSDKPHHMSAPGPFLAEQLKSKDRYELSNGHALFAPPTGQRGGKSNLEGGKVLATDPAVNSAGIDVGYSSKPKDLRAPDISIGNVEDAPGWAKAAPPLAVEYADVGQDEVELKKKISELFEAGTQFIWVVRLAAPERHVEVHEPGKLRQIRRAGELLSAPGILQNAVLVESLWDAAAANAATLRNLLNRHGYESLDAVRVEGREEGREAALELALDLARSTLVKVAEARGLTLDDAARSRINAEKSLSTLSEWTTRAATVAAGSNLF